MRLDIKRDIIYRNSPWRSARQDYYPMVEAPPTADADTPPLVSSVCRVAVVQ